jgi:hypothetical protein
METKDDWLSPAELADLYGISERTSEYWRAVLDGPPFYRVGKRVKYKARDVEAWLERRRVETLDRQQ